MTAFVDSSMFVAGTDRSDDDHALAAGILRSGEPFVTSDQVLTESWLVINRRLGKAAADAFWANVRAGSVSLEFVVASDVEAAWAIGQAFPDQDFSIVDCTSFAIMERLGIHRAASLDRDFAIYRYGPRRERAFEIVTPRQAPRASAKGLGAILEG